MQIKKPLSVVCYSIFLIYSWIFGEYVSAAGLNEIYEAIVVIGLFFNNTHSIYSIMDFGNYDFL